MFVDFIRCFAKVFNQIHIKNIISNICYYHAKTIKQDQLHLKHLYEVSVRIKSPINACNEALNQYSHFKKK